MNGGHYLTKGHVTLCLLYIKTSLMSRNILEPGKTVFSDANSPLRNQVLGHVPGFQLPERLH